MKAAGAARVVASLVLVSLAPLGGGCSFIFVSGAKREAPGRYVAAGCTTRKVAPSVDAILTGALASATILALSQSDATLTRVGTGTDRVLIVGVPSTLLFAASAMYGFAMVGTCREVTGYAVSPYERAPAPQTRSERLNDEAAEEAAVQARLKEKQAAEAKAAGEAAGRTTGKPANAP